MTSPQLQLSQQSTSINRGKIRVWFRRFPYDYYLHYISQALDEIGDLESQSSSMSSSQREAFKIAKEHVEDGIKALNEGKSLSIFWNHVNLFRIQRAIFVPDKDYPSFIVGEENRSKDYFDRETRRKWEPRLKTILSQLNASPQVTDNQRQVMFRFLQQAGRKWNSHNAKLDARRKAITDLTVLSIFLFPVALFLYFQPINPLFQAAAFGALGGIISASTTIRESRIEFRSWFLDIQYVLRPLVGAVVAVMLILALDAKISPIVIANWIVTPQGGNAALAVVSFGAGLSQQLILGKLNLLNSET